MVRGEHEMDPAEVRALLDELERRCRAAGVRAEIHIVGGSALALLFPEDEETRTTRDIDAVIRPRDEVERIVSEMADDLGLPDDWLNTRASAFVPPRPSRGLDEDDVVITTATVHELIAMKLASSREQDLHDLGLLARHARIDDPGVLVEIAYAHYGADSVVLNESREDYQLLAEQALRRMRRRQR